MTVSTYGCGSCALAEIHMLSAGGKNAQEAMVTFCEKELKGGVRYNASDRGKYIILAPIYVFVAGPEVKSGQAGSSHHSKDHWPAYGTDFAAFIVENELGTIATLPPRLNKKYHPDTTCQAWLWCPDQKAMEKWYNDHLDGKAAKAMVGKGPKV